MDAAGLPALDHLVKRGLAHCFHGGAVLDVVVGFHANLAADGVDLSHAVALSGNGGLAFFFFNLGAQRVNLALQVVKLAGLIVGQVAVRGAGAVGDFLLALDLGQHLVFLLHGVLLTKGFCCG